MALRPHCARGGSPKTVPRQLIGTAPSVAQRRFIGRRTNRQEMRHTPASRAAQCHRRSMNAPKHEDPAAPVKVGWGTAATLTVVAIAVLALVAWGGAWLHRGGDAGAAVGARPAVVAAAVTPQ